MACTPGPRLDESMIKDMRYTNSAIDPQLLSLPCDGTGTHGEIKYAHQIEGLFGTSGPSVPIIGSTTAITELQHAIRVDGLSVQPFHAPTPADLLPIAFHHLEQAMQFPSPHMLHTRRRLPIGGNILSLVQTDSIRAGYKPAHSSPQFLNFDINYVVAALRIAAEIQDEVMELALEQPVALKKAFHLGVVTMTRSHSAGDIFKAELFGSNLSVKQSVNTIWLFCCCQIKPNGMVYEQWRAIGDGHIKLPIPATEAVQAALTTTNYAKPYELVNTLIQAVLDTSDYTVVHGQATPQTHLALSGSPRVSVKKRKRNLPIRDESDSSTESDDVAKTSTPDSSQGVSAAQSRYRFLSYPPPCHLLDSEPQNISGANILSLAAIYSNQELFLMINKGLRRRGLSVLKDANIVTRRITLACNSVARKHGRGVSPADVRAELNQHRQANKIKERQHKRTLQTKAVNAERRRQTMAAHDAWTDEFNSRDMDEDGKSCSSVDASDSKMPAVVKK